MGDTDKLDLKSTYILDEDVMDEMENPEGTDLIGTEGMDSLSDTRTADDDFLDDIESQTIVLGDK